MRPHGHACVVEDICFDCGGKLKGEDGSFSEYHYDDGRVSFAAPICVYCKMIRVFVDEAPKMPKDFKARFTELQERRRATRANYAVAMWAKLVTDERAGEMRERRYVVNMNGTLVTRLDVCDLRRSLKSFQGDGWHLHELKHEYKTLKELLEATDKTLTAQEYRRIF